MAVFKCSGCGKCCASLGRYITVERNLSERDYYCRFGITNEIFFAHVQSDSAAAFSDRTEKDVHPEWCTFLRKTADGSGYLCTIYPTRPSLCRKFMCYWLVIFDSSGRECGRVAGRDDLKTTDHELKTMWNEWIVSHPRADDGSWVCAALTALAARGYRGETVE